MVTDAIFPLPRADGIRRKKHRMSYIFFGVIFQIKIVAPPVVALATTYGEPSAIGGRTAITKAT
ncbi:MAG: hypothetical protein NTY86_16065 [Deltaproteobacteria bacterium]|nr:hypothetical protein [Deltaproteobacteria bacterium]